MSYSEREQRVVALFEDRVREELRGTDGGYSLGLSEETIERLLDDVTAGVLYAFSSPAAGSVLRLSRGRSAAQTMPNSRPN